MNLVEELDFFEFDLFKFGWIWIFGFGSVSLVWNFGLILEEFWVDIRGIEEILGCHQRI